MSVSYIPEKTKLILWGKAAGRCQYDGCNKPLWHDSLTKAEFNTAYIAHIVADKPDGPRGDPELSEKLKATLSNLMLLCDEHHRLIDREDVDGHPVDRLTAMKRKHEDRVELLTSLSENKQSHVLLYGANIGQQTATVSWEKSFYAMQPTWYPAEKSAVEFSLKNSQFRDDEASYWLIERENLQRQYTQLLKPKLISSHIAHLSVFALAPQPLLIELGRLLSDIPAAEVYQLHREPPDWRWQDHPEDFDYVVREPTERNDTVALNLSLSATIDNSRIVKVLGAQTSIWTLTISDPGNDFLKSREQVRAFRETFRRLLDRIKLVHGQENILNIFPAVPVAIAVELGRVWMPKADLSMRIYDQNRQTDGFQAAFDIP